MLPDTVEPTPLLLLLLGVGLVWFCGAHPDKKILPAKTTDNANPKPLLPLNNDNPPPKKIYYSYKACYRRIVKLVLRQR
jgi:hypothetical protein